MDAKSIARLVERKSEWIKDRLGELVRQESASEDRPAVNGAMALVEGWGLEEGARIKRHRQREFGDVLELRFGPLRSKQKPVLLLGHLDTVWPMGTLKKMPWREADGRYWGPGLLDMKAGVVMALAAVSVLREAKLGRPARLLLNSDEDVGS